MAVDKLVDSTLLDAACTYEAGKIREKLGSSAQIAYDLANGKGFGDAIAAIETGGGAPARLIDSATITLASTATNQNKLSVNLTPATNCVVLVFLDDLPSSPDSSEYIALCWANEYTSYGSTGAYGSILRPTGAIGSDGNQCSFNKTTGVLQLGGSYGHFMAGTTYHIFEFEMGAA